MNREKLLSILIFAKAPIIFFAELIVFISLISICSTHKIRPSGEIAKQGFNASYEQIKTKEDSE